jgi:hypothetical protein
LADFQGNIKRILNSSPGATAAIRLILKTKLLNQLKATACESYAESSRSEDEDRRGSESRSSDVGVPPMRELSVIGGVSKQNKDGKGIPYVTEMSPYDS